MKEYEIVHEIFNSCSGNRMRDVAVSEEFVDDPVEYVKKRHSHERDFTYEVEEMPDGSLIIDLSTSGMRQRYSFSPL